MPRSPNKTKAFLSLLALCSSLAFSGQAHARFDYWSSIGAGCVSTDATIQGDRYLTVAGGVKPAPNATDLITLFCPVAPNEGAYEPNALYLTYRDSTGFGDSAYVQAQLWKMDRQSSAITPIATVRSDSYGDTGTVQHHDFFYHAFDFGRNHYFVRVDLDRSSAAEDIIFSGVALGNVIE